MSRATMPVAEAAPARATVANEMTCEAWHGRIARLEEYVADTFRVFGDLPDQAPVDDPAKRRAFILDALPRLETALRDARAAVVPRFGALGRAKAKHGLSLIEGAQFSHLRGLLADVLRADTRLAEVKSELRNLCPEHLQVWLRAVSAIPQVMQLPEHLRCDKDDKARDLLADILVQGADYAARLQAAIDTAEYESLQSLPAPVFTM